MPAFGGDNGYSYVFDGQWGSLDHALASDSAAPRRSLAADDWYINADEPSVLDYNTDFKSAGQIVSLYAADEFRMSDHNPVIVDLALDAESDGSSPANAFGHLLLVNSAGLKAGDTARRCTLRSASGTRDGPGSQWAKSTSSSVARRPMDRVCIK